MRILTSDGPAGPDSSGQTVPPVRPEKPRLLFLDALRAVASVIIMLHHFALYPPLCTQATPLLGPAVDWFHHYARATQVFFVVGGFVMARTMNHRTWNLRATGNFVAYRYCRLGLPYLAAIVLAIIACAVGRGLLPPEVTGAPPTVPQFIAHVFFVQDLLGFESFSAGLWFICINFQLGLMYVTLLLVRDAVTSARRGRVPRWWRDFPVLIGWLLSGYSLFHFNLEPEHDQWGLYFFPYFFTGIMVHHGLRDKKTGLSFFLYLILLAAGIAFHWRWRLASALVVGVLLFVAERTGFTTRWPKSRVIAELGKASYSLFLIHFPVLVLVASLWTACGWTSPIASSAGLLVAAATSIGLALPFHRWIEVSAGRLSRRRRGS